MKFAPIFIH